MFEVKLVYKLRKSHMCRNKVIFASLICGYEKANGSN